MGTRERRLGSRCSLGPIHRLSEQPAARTSLPLAGYLAEKRNLRSEPQYHRRKRTSKRGAWAEGVGAECCSPRRSVRASQKGVRKGAGVRVPAATRDARHEVAAACPTSTLHARRQPSPLRVRRSPSSSYYRRRDGSPGHGFYERSPGLSRSREGEVSSPRGGTRAPPTTHEGGTGVLLYSRGTGMHPPPHFF